MADKMGRNDLCFCGSGKKYKRCCYGLDDAQVPNNEFDIDAAVNESLSLFTSGSQKEAEKRIEELLKKSPHSSHAHYARGTMYAIQKNYDASINSFDEAIHIDPDCIEAYFNKAVAYQKLLDVKNVIKSYQEVVKRGRPDDEIVINARQFLDNFEESILKADNINLAGYMSAFEVFDGAFLRMENKEWQVAIDGFRKSLEINKNNPQCYGNIGICLAMLGKKEESLKAFDMALAIDPSYSPAIYNRKHVEDLKEGGKLGEEFVSIDFNKEKFLSQKSFINKN